LYTSSQETRIWVISPAGSAVVAAIKAHAGEIRDFNLLNDGAQLLTVGDDGMLRLWDTDSWQEIRAMQAHEGIISEVDVSPDGRMIATASRNDITPKVWDADTWEQLFSLEGHVSELQDTGFVSQGVWAVQFSPDGQRLTTAADDHTARIWDVTNGDLLLTLSGHGKDDYADLVDGDMVTRILFSPDGKLVATAGGDGTVRVWDAADGQMLLTLVGDPEEARHFSLAFSPDGRRLAAGGWSHTIEMWQLPDDPWSATDEDVAPLYQIPTGAGRLEQIRFSTNGERIVVVGSTGLAEIRDTDTGELLIGLQHPAGVSYAEFTPDGKRLMTGGQDGIFRIWALDLQELVTLARSRVTRELTDEECQQYLHRDACQNEE
jgi:WD40 repeat protein